MKWNALVYVPYNSQLALTITFDEKNGMTFSEPVPDLRLANMMGTPQGCEKFPNIVMSQPCMDFIEVTKAVLLAAAEQKTDRLFYKLNFPAPGIPHHRREEFSWLLAVKRSF